MLGSPLGGCEAQDRRDFGANKWQMAVTARAIYAGKLSSLFVYSFSPVLVWVEIFLSMKHSCMATTIDKNI